VLSILVGIVAAAGCGSDGNSTPGAGATTGSTGGATSSGGKTGTGGSTSSGGKTGSAVPGCGVVTELAFWQTEAKGIVATATDVAWIGNANDVDGQGYLAKIPIGGGTPVTLASNLDAGTQLATDGTNLYWVAPNDGNIMKIALAGGNAVPIVTGQGQLADIIAVDATSVYWRNAQNEIMKAPLAGGTPTTLASNVEGQNIAVSASAVYLSAYDPNTTSDNSWLASVPLNGGAAKQFGPTTEGEIDWVAVNATTVSWITNNGASGASISTVATAGGTAVTLVKDSSADFIAVDDTNVYYVNENVMKVPLAGGTPVTLTTINIPAVTSDPAGIALDATSVYWTDYSQRILKTSKCNTP